MTRTRGRAPDDPQGRARRPRPDRAQGAPAGHSAGGRTPSSSSVPARPPSPSPRRPPSPSPSSPLLSRTLYAYTVSLTYGVSLSSETMSQPAQRRAPLTRERVVRAAIALADEGGIEALSMRKLAKDLGVEAMSLYNHVSNKGDLVDAMVDLVVREIELPADPDWESAIRRC